MKRHKHNEDKEAEIDHAKLVLKSPLYSEDCKALARIVVAQHKEIENLKKVNTQLIRNMSNARRSSRN